MDDARFEAKWGGRGKVLSRLEFQLRLYIALNGALHDSAVAAWGAKGHYDYVRPVSAIRYLDRQAKLVFIEQHMSKDSRHRISIDTWRSRDDYGPLLACRWVPYQRPSFVTPPFAGYVSGVFV
jgi:hypothetical protein